MSTMPKRRLPARSSRVSCLSRPCLCNTELNIILHSRTGSPLGPAGRRARLAYPTYPPGYLPEASHYQHYPRHHPHGTPASIADDDSERETTLERLRRLRLETEELEEQLEAERARAEEDQARRGGPNTAGGDDAQGEEGKEDGQKGTVVIGGKKRGGDPSPALLLAQLRYLRGDLSRLSGEAEKLAQSSGESDGSEKQSAERASALLARLGSQRSDKETSDSVVAELRRAGVAAGGQMDPNSLGRLDDRLARLEKFVGANEADVDEVGKPSILFSHFLWIVFFY
jgi:nuclear migration protein JNM1